MEHGATAMSAFCTHAAFPGEHSLSPRCHAFVHARRTHHAPMFPCARKCRACSALRASLLSLCSCAEGGAKRFCKGGDRAVFEHFYVSTSNPVVVRSLPMDDGVFVVLDLLPQIIKDL